MGPDDIHDDFDIHSREQITREDQARQQKDSLWPYIGHWQALKGGTAYRQLLRELLEQGIQPRIGRELPLEDPLARYKNIPLHARFLYTSMDLRIEYSILKHYTTLEGLSRDRPSRVV